MITGTSYSPAKAFIDFARQFLIALSEGDTGNALKNLDMTQKKWSKIELLNSVERSTSGKGVCNPAEIRKSASPELLESNNKNDYVLRHRIPSDGKWLNQFIVFKFERSKGEYFKVTLVGFEP